MASRAHGAVGGRGNRERDDRGKRPMVDPDPICEPVEETFEKRELTPIIMEQPTSPSTRGQGGLEVEGTVIGTTRASALWNTFKLYNTPGTNMGVRRLVEHLCELGRQTYEGWREIVPALPPFDTAIKTRFELWAESVPYKLMHEYKIWIKTKVFKDWSDASYERMGASHIAGRLATDEGKTWLVKKIEIWKRWLNASKPRQVKLGSFSWKMKDCEPISDNQLRWIMLKTQISDLTHKLGQGSYGSVYLIGFWDVALGLELGMEGVMPYVAKKCDEKPPYSAWVMMHKELASFDETHCAIVRPIACHNIKAEPILVYPYWNGRDIRQWKNLEHTTRGTRLPDNSGRLMNLITDHSQWFRDPSEEKDQRKWKNVFAALGDLGMAQQVHVAASVNGRKYPRVPKKEHDWIVPELVDSKIQKLAARNIHIHPVYEYNKATNMYVLGVLTHQMRTSAAQCFEVMSDNMKINPMTCSRPTETPSQQRKERTNVYEEYLNAERVNMAYGLAYQEMRQLGLLLPE
ncbi:hypothetical protein R1sor_022350 [Riccia sorocarpa]|uniref:Uncharacterized protein n=1 Tax=Riccia sorocarpa TaxID=122646 RepID=A0ABD3GLT7_9MARC